MADVDKALSVKELIERLSKLPPEAPVWCMHALHYGPVCDPVELNIDDPDIGPHVPLFSLWLAPDEYTDKVWIDHEGKRQVIPCYGDDENQS